MRKISPNSICEIKKIVRIVNARPFEERRELLNQVNKRMHFSVSKTSQCLEIANNKRLSKRFVEIALIVYANMVNRGDLHTHDLPITVHLLLLLRRWMIEYDPDHIFELLVAKLHFNRHSAVTVRRLAKRVASGSTPKKARGLDEDRFFDICYKRTMNA